MEEKIIDTIEFYVQEGELEKFVLRAAELIKQGYVFQQIECSSTTSENDNLLYAIMKRN